MDRYLNEILPELEIDGKDVYPGKYSLGGGGAYTKGKN
jgi:hypothetical protein